ncbi:MAG TPA: DUF1569 domain-containing protein [Tepidisphaeraceae bacterium]|jgi:hypothetical protein|nr:DUF1569 domain-containing protein [Tepidisphaeraceae bacterium]
MERRPLQFTTLDDAVTDARHLFERGYDRAGKWNLAQVCDHLTKLMTMSRDGFGETGFGWPLRLFGRLAKPLILRMKTMPKGLDGPAAFMPAANLADDAAAAEALADAVRRILEPGATFHPSPLLGRLTRDQWISIHRVHAAHHLGFLVPR